MTDKQIEQQIKKINDQLHMDWKFSTEEECLLCVGLENYRQHLVMEREILKIGYLVADRQQGTKSNPMIAKSIAYLNCWLKIRKDLGLTRPEEEPQTKKRKYY